MQSLGSGTIDETAQAIVNGIVTEAELTPKCTWPTSFMLCVPAFEQSVCIRRLICNGAWLNENRVSPAPD